MWFLLVLDAGHEEINVSLYINGDTFSGRRAHSLKMNVFLKTLFARIS